MICKNNISSTFTHQTKCMVQILSAKLGRVQMFQMKLESKLLSQTWRIQPMLRIKSMVDITETTSNNPEVHIKLMHNITLCSVKKKEGLFCLSFKQKQLFPCFEEFYDKLLLCKIHSKKKEKNSQGIPLSPRKTCLLDVVVEFNSRGIQLMEIVCNE